MRTLPKPSVKVEKTEKGSAKAGNPSNSISIKHPIKDTFCVFSSMGRYTKWGSWGVMEYYDQKETDAPKMMALREWMKK